MSNRNIDLYLQDILKSIRKIEDYTEGYDFDKFLKDMKTVDAVIRNFSVIGEAIRNIPKNIREKAPNIPWNEILGMRNKIIHEYFGVDHEILWKTVREDLPVFKEQIGQLKRDL